MVVVVKVSPKGSAAATSDPEGRDIQALFREHGPAVSRWAAGLGGPSVDVEDAVQDVFLVAARRIGEFRGDAKLSTWLFRITLRVVKHHRRRARLRQWLSGSAEETAGHLAACRPSPAEEYERKEAGVRLYAILDRMKEKFRTVIVLAKLEELGTDEIAAMTGVERATVRVWLHRGIAEFRRLADKERGTA